VRADIHDGQEHKRSMQGPDTEAQDHPPFAEIRLATHGRSIQLVPDVYKRLLGDEKIDLVLAGPTRSPVLEKSEKIPLINQADRSSLPSTPMPFRRIMLATSCKSHRTSGPRGSC